MRGEELSLPQRGSMNSNQEREEKGLGQTKGEISDRGRSTRLPRTASKTEPLVHSPCVSDRCGRGGLAEQCVRSGHLR